MAMAEWTSAVRAEMTARQRWPAARGRLRSVPMAGGQPAAVTISRTGRRCRRALDVVVATGALAVFAVPMVLIALVVATTSRGPVLYRQTRVGRNGQPIRLVKFRSMCLDADRFLERDAELRAAYVANDFKIDSKSDPRITRVGRVLRKTSLDELPQLWNVLRSDMSIVGVRPLLFEELATRPGHDQDLYRLLAPGMTGLWQVRGRSTVGAVDRIALDREYVENWSLRNDVRLLLATPGAVLRIHHTH